MHHVKVHNPDRAEFTRHRNQVSVQEILTEQSRAVSTGGVRLVPFTFTVQHKFSDVLRPRNNTRRSLLGETGLRIIEKDCPARRAVPGSLPTGVSIFMERHHQPFLGVWCTLGKRVYRRRGCASGKIGMAMPMRMHDIPVSQKTRQRTPDFWRL